MELIKKDKEAVITQEILKERLHYDKDTGIFTWLDNKLNKNCVRGKKAGSINCYGYMQLDIVIRGKRYNYRQHRLAWLYEYGEFPKGNLDHINHNKVDNRIKNLRIATPKENARNRSMNIRNKTGYNGVDFIKDSGMYRARIRVDNKSMHIGCFKNVEDAAKAAREAREHYGFHVNHGQAND